MSAADAMNEPQRPRSGLRDATWLMILALVLAAWGWDRGRLATHIESLKPQIAQPGTVRVPALGLGGVSYDGVDIIIDEVPVSPPMIGSGR